MRRERSNGVEFSLRQRVNRVRIDGSFFHYRIRDFVFLAAQDADGNGSVDVAGNLPIGNYVQSDARFTGADATVDVDINKYVAAFFVGDIVRARLSDSDASLPRITPARARVGLDFRYRGLSVRPEAIFASRKSEDAVFPLETATAGYGLFNINGSYTFGNDRAANIISVSAFNLNDQLFRNHLSFIKNLAPEPGRGIRASYTLRFF